MPTTLDEFVLGRTLGSGVSCKVKLAQEKSTHKKYAIKVMNSHTNQQLLDLMQTEVKILQSLQHENIVNLIKYETQGKLHSSAKDKVVTYIVLELVGGGELFDFVANSGAFSDKISRYYFKQMLNGLKYMHSAGVAHRDLKPENIMLTEDFTLKIADFGFAAPIEGRDQSGFLTSVLGTESYMAPEIHLHKPYTGAGVDLFAAGIILFIMISQRPPFNKADIQDPHYRLIAGNRHELFWQAHEQVCDGDNPYSPEFKDLFNKMMALNPSQRPSIENILAHPWVQGDCATTAEVQAEFKSRKVAVDQEVAAEAEQRRTERAQKGDKRKVTRDNPDPAVVALNQELERLGLGSEAEDKRELVEFEADMARNTQFFSSSSPEQLMIGIIENFHKDEAVKYDLSDKKWKLKFTMAHGGPANTVECVLNLFKVSEDVICADFQRNAGNSLTFFKQYQKIAEELACFNDTVYAKEQ